MVNENPMDKLIRELREENEKLKKFLEGGGTPAVQDVGGGGAALSAEGGCFNSYQMREENGTVLETLFGVETNLICKETNPAGALF